MSEANQNIEELLFDLAVQKPTPAERAAFLDGVCRDNPNLRATLERLLSAHFGEARFLPMHEPQRSHTVLIDPAASALRLGPLAHTNGQAVVSFTAGPNLTYTVEASNQASGGAWEKVADVIARATEHMESVTDPQATGASRFYRVVTPRQP